MSGNSRIAALVIAAVVILALAGGIVAAAVSSGPGGTVSLRCSSAGAGAGAGCVTPSTSSATTSTGATSTTVARRRPARVDDGSLGNRATRLACTLLSRAEIAKEFGGPVGEPTPTYPYCQWLVGKNSFVALDVEPVPPSTPPLSTSTRSCPFTVSGTPPSSPTTVTSTSPKARRRSGCCGSAWGLLLARHRATRSPRPRRAGASLAGGRCGPPACGSAWAADLLRRRLDGCRSGVGVVGAP